MKDIRRSTLSLFLLVVTLSALGTAPSHAQENWAWPGAEWADYTAFMSPITQEVKTKCLAIMNSPAGQQRIGMTGPSEKQGRPGFFGDSITVTQAYFVSLARWCVVNNETGVEYGCDWSYEPSGEYNPREPSGILDEWMDIEWLSANLGKGGEYCNDSGWLVQTAIDNGHPERAVLQEGYSDPPGNYSWALIMYGTNDVDKKRLDWMNPSTRNSWKATYSGFIDDIIALGVIPVLSTIPPRHSLDNEYITVDEVQYTAWANEIIVDLATEKKIPWVDLHGLITHLQPPPYNYGLMGSDGVHLSASPGATDFSKAALTGTNGYGMRTKLTIDVGRKIKAIIFEDGPYELGGIEPPVTCLEVITTQPAEGGTLEDSQGLAIIFDGYLNESSFDGRVSARGSRTGAFQVTLEHSLFSVVLRLNPKPQQEESITVTLADGISNLSGDLLDGDEDGECGGAFVWTLVSGQQSTEPDPEEPPVDVNILTVAVDGYTLAFSDLSPGGELRIYDTAGHLLHRVHVDTTECAIDTRQALGNFSHKQLIVVYQGRKQHFMVGPGLQYRSYLE